MRNKRMRKKSKSYKRSTFYKSKSKRSYSEVNRDNQLLDLWNPFKTTLGRLGF